MKLSCLIVEDQLPAQRILARYLSDHPDVNHAGSCVNAFDAMAFLHKKSVDLMFLDLNLPRFGGFEFLRSLRHPPRVIVTTAYPEHAVEGFELEVIDYLVKPIAFERFARAIDKVRHAMISGAPFGLVPRGDIARDAAEEIFVKTGTDRRRVTLSDIVFLRAEGDYVTIVLGSESIFATGTLSKWEERLSASNFVRTHKSYIVNLRHVVRVTGNSIVTSQGGVAIGRSYREAFLARLD